MFAVLCAALLGAMLAHPQEKQTTATTNTTTIAPQLQSTDTYAAKFICGVQQDNGAAAIYDAQPGSYSSKVNVHNNTGQSINFRKKIIWLLKPGPQGQPPIYNEQPTSPQATKFDTLNGDQALEVVCRDIYGMLGLPVVPPPSQAVQYAEGFVIFEVYYPQNAPKPPGDPLDVEGIYTYRGFQGPGSTGQTQCCGVSINVVTYQAKHNAHLL